MKITNLLVLLLTSLIMSVTFAADEAGITGKDKDDKDSAIIEEKPAVSTKTQQAPVENFTPTESISEDLSVPFPVDI
jgi:hypothetical protein